ncbi:MAG: DUF4230 domain-containing protein [Synergistaceae bacterium]|nr:DUF4230 domain-containing protein [Synergistaceae bacterium]
MSLFVLSLLLLSVAANVMLVTRARRRERPRSVRSAILQGIQDVSELATVRERFQSIVSFSEGWQIPLLKVDFPGTTRRFMMRYSGTIVCGCDLSAADVSERSGTGRVRIIVPRSHILDVYADVRSFEVYDQSAGIFTSIRLEDQNREVMADLEEVRAHALRDGILAQADENVRRILTSVASAAGMEAEISFMDRDADALHVGPSALGLASVGVALSARAGDAEEVPVEEGEGGR